MNRNLKAATRLAGRLKRWHYIVASIVLACLVAVVIFFSLFGLLRVGSESMSPTLSTGDRLIARRFGLRPTEAILLLLAPLSISENRLCG